MTLDPNAGLVCEDNVVEGFANFNTPFAKRQTSNTVRLPDDLAVLRTGSFPS